MTTRVHHLNCATLRPPCAKIINGTGGFFSRGRLVCHCLLVETEDGLVLVDTGLGLGDVKDPSPLGRQALFMMKPPLDEQETAVRQVESLGFTAADVKHIVMTHLDMDHTGGLPDFPHARVHLHAREHDAAMNPPTKKEKWRYVPAHMSHDPAWVPHENGAVDWFGFDGVNEILPGIVLVPLFGHTRGHCAVGVRTDRGWMVHCGDAYTDRCQIGLATRAWPKGPRFHQRKTAIDFAATERVHSQLKHLALEHPEEISICCSHDPVEFSSFKAL